MKIDKWSKHNCHTSYQSSHELSINRRTSYQSPHELPIMYIVWGWVEEEKESGCMSSRLYVCTFVCTCIIYYICYQWSSLLTFSNCCIQSYNIACSRINNSTKLFWVSTRLFFIWYSLYAAHTYNTTSNTIYNYNDVGKHKPTNTIIKWTAKYTAHLYNT